MALYLESSGSFSVWLGEPVNGIKHPLNIEQLWSAGDLAAIGLYSPAPADPIPTGKVAASTMVQRVNGVVKFVNALVDAPPLTRISKYDLIMRLEDDEADMLLADFNDARGKQSLLWGEITYVDTKDPAYPILRAVVVNRLGETRAAEVLAPME